MQRGFKVVRQDARKTSGDIILPRRATSKSAGYDFYSPMDAVVRPGEVVVVWTDVKAYMLPDEMLKLFVRSSIGKKKVVLANGTGITDSDYFENPGNDGNIGIMLINHGDSPFEVRAGDRIAQGIFEKYLVVDNDAPVKENRAGGMGSTGT